MSCDLNTPLILLPFPKLDIHVESCRDVVSFFHHSVKASEKLKEIQLPLGIPENKLVQEVETRWNSTYNMFERITEQHQAITTALCLSGRNAMCLSSSDVSLLKAAMAILKPFEATTKEISADKHVSIFKVIPLANSRQCLTGAITEKDTPLVSNLSYQMRRHFTNIESARMLAISTLLDPRIKKLAFSDSAAVRQAEQWVVQEMSGHVQTNDSNEDRQPSNTTEAAGLWDLSDSVVQQSTSQRTSTSNATLEARKYFEESVLARLQDPSLWWKENERYYELIAKIAKKYLCIPGTSVPAEGCSLKQGS